MDRVAVAKELMKIAKEMDERYEETGDEKYLRVANAVNDTFKQVVAEHKAMRRAAQSNPTGLQRSWQGLKQVGRGAGDWFGGLGESAIQAGNAYNSLVDQGVQSAANYGKEFGEGVQIAGQAIGQGFNAAARPWTGDTPKAQMQEAYIAIQNSRAQQNQLMQQMSSMPEGPQKEAVRQQIRQLRQQAAQIEQQYGWSQGIGAYTK